MEPNFKRLLHVQQIGQSNDYYCPVCHTMMQGEVTAIIHSKGQRHLREIRKIGNIKELDERFLSQIDQNNTFHCPICNKIIAGKEPKKQHCDGTLYKQNVKEFEERFICKNGIVTCRKCKFQGPWTMYVDHGDRRGINEKTYLRKSYGILKDLPSDSAKITCKEIFDNFITQHPMQGFSCHACLTLLANLSSVAAHISDANHQRLKLENDPIELADKKETVSEEQCKMLVSNCILKKCKFTYQCEICTCKISHLSNVLQHIVGDRHFANSKLCSDFLLRRAKLRGGSQTHLRLPNKLKSTVELLGLQILNDRVVCRPCGKFFMSVKAVQSHLTYHTPKMRNCLESENSAKQSNEKSSRSLDRNENRSKRPESKSGLETSEPDDSDRRRMSARDNLELSTRMTFVIDNWTAFCFICEKIIPLDVSKFYKHVSGATHNEYLLNMLEMDEQFENCRDQFSNLTLATELMQELLHDVVFCHACDMRIKNENSLLKAHVATAMHKTRTSLRKEDSKRIFAEVYQRMKVKIEAPIAEEAKPRAPVRKDHKTSANSRERLRSMRLLFKRDDIYNASEAKLRDIKLSTRMTVNKDSEQLYCLVCLKIVPNKLQDYYEHIHCLEHVRCMKIMMKDDALFENQRDQLSELALANEFIHETSEEWAKCFACDAQIRNKDALIREHIGTETHETMCLKWRNDCDAAYDEISSQLEDAWYHTHYYWCQPCDVTVKLHANFVEHLDGEKHAKCLKDAGCLSEGELVYDICVPCGILWLGRADLYAIHCQDKMHKYLVQSRDYTNRKIPSTARSLLSNLEQAVEKLVAESDKVLREDRDKEIEVLRGLESTIRSRFQYAKVFTYGSRAAGLAFQDSDINVFLDIGDMYRGMGEYVLKTLTESIANCLLKEKQYWYTEQVLTDAKPPSIKVYHVPTELMCNISFIDGLVVENTNMIKCFAEKYPMYRKLVLFLKKLMFSCGLAKSDDGMTNYAIAWFVIFYLQDRKIFPSIASLLQMQNHFKIIAGWDVGVCYKFHFKSPDLSFAELLTGFFEFYAEFDYRYEVACPLLGGIVKKQAFLKSQDLPKEMELYIERIKSSDDPDHFRIDCPMCLQDPFDLSHNLTMNVTKINLNRFRQFCHNGRAMLIGDSR